MGFLAALGLQCFSYDSVWSKKSFFLSSYFLHFFILFIYFFLFFLFFFILFFDGIEEKVPIKYQIR